MKISLEALQILDAIDRRGSFAAAAKVLFKVPSTISYTVSKLEDDLGVQLFERLGPKATPTQAGRELLREGGTYCVPRRSWRCGCGGWRRVGNRTLRSGWMRFCRWRCCRRRS